MVDAVFHQRFIHQFIDGGNPEHIIIGCAVLGDFRTGRPDAHERYFHLIDQRHDGQGNRRIKTTKEHGDFFSLDQFASGEYALGRVAFVVTTHQLQLTPEHAAAGIDLVDGHGQAPGQRLAGFGRLTRKGGDQADLDRRFGRLRGTGHCQVERDCCSHGKQQTLQVWKPDGHS
ncbi:hypothetical protein D3C86_1375950 [compost metagenome]